MTQRITTDGNHGFDIIKNGSEGDYMAFATQRNEERFEYWFTVGRSYKTEEAAERFAKKALAKHGYTI